MTKVDPLGRGMGALPGAKRKPRKGSVGSDPPPERTAEGIPANIVPLVEAVGETGQALQHDPTGEHLESYKEAVRLFLDAALSASMQVTSESTFGLSQKVFSTIARIDVSLADLTDAVLGRQQSVLKLREIVDQIKGLIVDLYR